MKAARRGGRENRAGSVIAFVAEGDVHIRLDLARRKVATGDAVGRPQGGESRVEDVARLPFGVEIGVVGAAGAAGVCRNRRGTVARLRYGRGGDWLVASV